MSKTFQDWRDYKKTSILIETVKMLQIDTFNVSCFSTWILLTTIQRETAWVSESNNQQLYKISNKKNSWQTASMRKNAISH